MIDSHPTCSSCHHESASSRESHGHQELSRVNRAGRGICSSQGARPSHSEGEIWFCLYGCPILRARLTRRWACAPKTSRSGNGPCSPGRPPQFGGALGNLRLADLPRKRSGCYPEPVRDNEPKFSFWITSARTSRGRVEGSGFAFTGAPSFAFWFCAKGGNGRL